MNRRVKQKLMKNIVCVGVFLLVAAQLGGCGWYMRPKAGNAQFAGGPGAGSAWSDGGAGAGAGAGSGSGLGDAGAGGLGWDNAGADTGKTRLGGQPVAMLDTVYFDYDMSNIRPDQLTVLERNLAWMRQNPGSPIRLEGHADERGTEEYNFALGDNRADSVREWLIAHGKQGGEVETVSKGELEPAIEGSGEGSWAQNRRVEFLILQ